MGTLSMVTTVHYNSRR